MSNSPTNDSNSEEYEVEDIIDCRQWRGNLYYLIKWLGYEPEYNSWEPAVHLSKVAELTAKKRRAFQKAHLSGNLCRPPNTYEHFEEYQQDLRARIVPKPKIQGNKVPSFSPQAVEQSLPSLSAEQIPFGRVTPRNEFSSISQLYDPFLSEGNLQNISSAFLDGEFDAVSAKSLESAFSTLLLEGTPITAAPQRLNRPVCPILVKTEEEQRKISEEEKRLETAKKNADKKEGENLPVVEGTGVIQLVEEVKKRVTQNMQIGEISRVVDEVIRERGEKIDIKDAVKVLFTPLDCRRVTSNRITGEDRRKHKKKEKKNGGLFSSSSVTAPSENPISRSHVSPPFSPEIHDLYQIPRTLSALSSLSPGEILWREKNANRLSRFHQRLKGFLKENRSFLTEEGLLDESWEEEKKGEERRGEERKGKERRDTNYLPPVPHDITDDSEEEIHRRRLIEQFDEPEELNAFVDAEREKRRKEISFQRERKANETIAFGSLPLLIDENVVLKNTCRVLTILCDPVDTPEVWEAIVQLSPKEKGDEERRGEEGRGEERTGEDRKGEERRGEEKRGEEGGEKIGEERMDGFFRVPFMLLKKCIPVVIVDWMEKNVLVANCHTAANLRRLKEVTMENKRDVEKKLFSLRLESVFHEKESGENQEGENEREEREKREEKRREEKRREEVRLKEKKLAQKKLELKKSSEKEEEKRGEEKKGEERRVAEKKAEERRVEERKVEERRVEERKVQEKRGEKSNLNKEMNDGNATDTIVTEPDSVSSDELGLFATDSPKNEGDSTPRTLGSSNSEEGRRDESRREQKRGEERRGEEKRGEERIGGERRGEERKGVEKKKVGERVISISSDDEMAGSERTKRKGVDGILLALRAMMAQYGLRGNDDPTAVLESVIGELVQKALDSLSASNSLSLISPLPSTSSTSPTSPTSSLSPRSLVSGEKNSRAALTTAISHSVQGMVSSLLQKRDQPSLLEVDNRLFNLEFWNLAALTHPHKI